RAELSGGRPSSAEETACDVERLTRDDFLAASLLDCPTHVDPAFAAARLARDIEHEPVARAQRERLEQRQVDLIPVRARPERARRKHDARHERALPPER